MSPNICIRFDFFSDGFRCRFLYAKDKDKLKKKKCVVKTNSQNQPAY